MSNIIEIRGKMLKRIFKKTTTLALIIILITSSTISVLSIKNYQNDDNTIYLEYNFENISFSTVKISNKHQKFSLPVY